MGPLFSLMKISGDLFSIVGSKFSSMINEWWWCDCGEWFGSDWCKVELGDIFDKFILFSHLNNNNLTGHKWIFESLQ